MYVPYKRKFRSPKCYKSRDTLSDLKYLPNHIIRTAHNKLCVTLNEPPG